MLFEMFLFSSNETEKPQQTIGDSSRTVTLNPLILNHTWGRSYWRMVFHEYAQQCIRTLDNYKKMVRRCPVFVRLFLFQILFLYHSFSSLLFI